MRTIIGGEVGAVPRGGAPLPTPGERPHDPGVTCGVSAARSGGPAAHLRPEAGGHVLYGTVDEEFLLHVLRRR